MPPFLQPFGHGAKISNSGYPIFGSVVLLGSNSTTYAVSRNVINQSSASLYPRAVLAICGKRSKIVKDLISCDDESEHLIAIDDSGPHCGDNGSCRTV